MPEQDSSSLCEEFWKGIHHLCDQGLIVLHLCTGDLGARGPRGVIGPTGLKGFPGPAGKRGFEGRIGKRGQQGKPGLKGKTGRVVRSFILCLSLFEVCVLSDFVKTGRARHTWCQRKGARVLHAFFLVRWFCILSSKHEQQHLPNSLSISIPSGVYLHPSANRACFPRR